MSTFHHASARRGSAISGILSLAQQPDSLPATPALSILGVVDFVDDWAPLSCRIGENGDHTQLWPESVPTTAVRQAGNLWRPGTSVWVQDGVGESQWLISAEAEAMSFGALSEAERYVAETMVLVELMNETPEDLLQLIPADLIISLLRARTAACLWVRGSHRDHHADDATAPVAFPVV